MNAATAPLIDGFLHTYDVRERHHIRVKASPAVVYDAILATDLSDSGIVQGLLFLRALPAALGGGLDGVRALARRNRPSVTLATLQANGFHLLAERPPEEIVVGIEGKFWSPAGAECTNSRESFAAPVAAGMARSVWDFRVISMPEGEVELTTETRVLCADAATRRRFLPYWTLIRPGSGLIRQAMLRAIKATAERATAPAGR